MDGDKQEALCDSCGVRVARYKCPGCAKRSCSVECVKAHKSVDGCSGKRCKTGYFSLSEFTDNHLMSDYCFLEDVGRVADSMNRDLRCLNHEQRDSRGLTYNLQWVRTRAKERGTELLLLPEGMSLHKLNTSLTVRSKGSRRKAWSIHWRVHLVFPSCENIEFHEERVPEDVVLSELLVKYLHPTQSDPIIRHTLQLYIRAGGVAAIAVYLKTHTAAGSRFKRLDIGKSLRDNLRHRTVLEFPILHVVLRSECSCYDQEELTRASPQTMVVNQKVVASSSTQTIAAERCLEDGEVESDSEPSDCSSLQLIARMYSNS